MWKISIPFMQDFKCNQLSNGETLTLQDSRDYEKYQIKRTTDGKCWMMEDLRISNKHLTPQDSNLLYDFDLPASGANEGFGSGLHNPVVYIQNINNEDSGLYSWHSAAGLSSYTGTSSNNCQSGMVNNHNECNYSICPLGWKLPTASYGGSIGGQLNLTSGNTSYFHDHGSLGFPTMNTVINTYLSNQIRVSHDTCNNGAVTVYNVSNSPGGTATPSFGSANLIRCYTE